MFARILEFVRRQPRLIVSAEALLLLGLIGWIDLITGHDISLGIFYAIPILFAASFCDRRLPFVVAAISCIVWSWADLAGGHQYSSHRVEAFEISIRCGYFFAVAIAGVAVMDKHRAAEARLAGLEYKRRLEHQVNAVMDYEQQRIGRELHDGLCQYLAAVSCAATALKIDLERRALPDFWRKADEIEKLLSRAVEQGRDLARNLSPVTNNEAGLAAALQELTAATTRRYGITCTFDCVDESGIACAAKATQLYRIAQEAIDNAVNHGRAHAIEVQLSANRSVLSLTVADDGIGFSKTDQSLNGIGIRLMKYRASVLNGQVEFEDGCEGGTVVSCIVPTSALT